MWSFYIFIVLNLDLSITEASPHVFVLYISDKKFLLQGANDLCMRDKKTSHCSPSVIGTYVSPFLSGALRVQYVWVCQGACLCVCACVYGLVYLDKLCICLAWEL